MLSTQSINIFSFFWVFNSGFDGCDYLDVVPHYLKYDLNGTTMTPTFNPTTQIINAISTISPTSELTILTTPTHNHTLIPIPIPIPTPAPAPTPTTVIIVTRPNKHEHRHKYRNRRNPPISSPL